jgi:hypothetical protein
MTVQDLTRRLVKLEQTVARLSPPRSGAWYLAHAGQFTNDPVYDQIVRRGRAYRRSLRPAGRAKRRGKKR